jgi:hypothetical protein
MPSSQQTAGNEAPRRDIAAIEEKVAELEKAPAARERRRFRGSARTKGGLGDRRR